jgi:ubiquinone/menaquinone biosynthesis C-methylase UbiE
MLDESERIQNVYRERDALLPPDLYSHFNRGSLFLKQQCERALLSILLKHGVDQLAGQKILDVGCGTGGILGDFLKYGAEPEKLYGVDILEDRVLKARYRYPNFNLFHGDARDLPFDDNFFDMVSQFTVFTSILDGEIKAKAAQEMLRVVKKDGLIVWYDFRYSNPRNQNVKGVSERELRNLFPECSFLLKKTTLLPPLTRFIGRYFLPACSLISLFPFLLTHLMVGIRPPVSKTGPIIQH